MRRSIGFDRGQASDTLLIQELTLRIVQHGAQHILQTAGG